MTQIYTKKEIITAMKNCPQTQGQSVLQHGFSVKNYLFDLINHLKTRSALKYEYTISNTQLGQVYIIFKKIQMIQTRPLKILIKSLKII